METKKPKKKYVTDNSRRTKEEVLESKIARYTLDMIWNGLTNSEKKEVLLIFEKAEMKKTKKLGEDN